MKDADDGDVKKYSLARMQMTLWTLVVIALFGILWTITGRIPTLNGTALTLIGISFASGAVSVAVTNPEKQRKSVSGHVLKDLVSDGNEVSIHRFQNLLFFMVFLVAFICMTLYNVSFAEFDATQLGLMGISAAGYVGIKAATEQQPAKK